MLENIILDGLRQNLMAPEFVKEFTDAFIKEVNQQSRDQRHEIGRRRRELADVSRDLDGLVDAIASGLRGASVLLHPGEHGPEIELVGDIAGMVELTLPNDGNAARERAAVSDGFRRSVKVVAGRGFEPLTFRL